MRPILTRKPTRYHSAIGLMTLVFTCSIAGAQSRHPSALTELKTRAERTNFNETSRYDDVIAFLKTVDEASDLVHVTSYGYSFEGRALPLAVVGRVSDARGATVRATGRLRVYLQANIHAGEVEGKEAVQALVRDIARGAHREWLDSMVLLVSPVYNADGTERVSLTSRGLQHGPIGGQGTRANAQNLNINRDDIKLDTPEARSMVKMLNDYDPHVMVDLHTTNGSRHAYHLTYETPNNPAVDSRIVALSHEWMAHLTKTIKAKDGWDFRAYGNVSGQAPQRVWSTVEDLPRYTHNYWGMRNRFGILSETYSYLPFADRVTTNARFLEELLGFAHANAARLREAAAAADKQPLVGQQVSLRSRLKRSPEMVEILMGDVEEDVNPYSGRVMHKRLDVRIPERMWEEASFEASETERVPTAYFVLPEQKVAIERLRAHGIVLEPVKAPLTVSVEEFQIASTDVAPQAFENHQERSVTGKYVAAERTIPAGAYRVPMNQPLARLAFYLLEPRSNDGLVTWNVLDDAIKQSQYPILRTRN
jgi:Zinc carboxypeptidase